MILTWAQVLQVGEVAAVMVGLNHGLGKTEDLLRQNELQEAGRVRNTDLPRDLQLTQLIGNICWTNSLRPVIDLCQSVDFVSHDEAIQPEWAQSEQSNPLENILLGWHRSPCWNGNLGTVVGDSAFGRLQYTTFH